MNLTEWVAVLERRAADAEAIHASAPVGALYQALLEELATLTPNGHQAPAPATAVLLTVEAAAARLGVSVRWLYRRADTLPFTRRLGPKTLRFDAEGLARWAARR